MPSKTQQDSFEHGPLPVRRIAPRDQEAGFAERLLVQGAAARVGHDWNGDIANLPQGVDWVLYPNGDLEPIRK